MSLLAWCILFAVTSLFWSWVLFAGGAEWLEGSILSGLLIDWFAPRWSAEGIKLFVGVSWVLQGIWFAIGLAVPAARFWW